MGKSWDSSGIAFNTDVWLECLRVLKPGGHLLAFGGSRTWHRIAVAVEDAGFQIRDSVAWLYGSGFPKSLDVSKAIDKSDAGEKRLRRNFQFTEWMRSTGITARQIDDITQTKIGSHYTTHPTQPRIATADLFDMLRPYLPEVPEEIERLVTERTVESDNYKKREVIGSKSGSKSIDNNGHGIIPGGIVEKVELDITAPATVEAQKWQGWGTALKPAFEPVVVARKPLIGTVAENVLAHGTGGLNIDATRINNLTDKEKNWTPQRQHSENPIQLGGAKLGDIVSMYKEGGRWPSNVMLDEFTAGLVDEQSGVSKSTPSAKKEETHSEDIYGKGLGNWSGSNHSDTGGASRFFYIAKASKRDRNEGLDELPSQEIGAKGNGLARSCATCSASVINGCDCPDRTFVNPTRQNFHPTVKPTDLMRQLVRLVTPPGGLVLDPFTGSGSTGKAAILEGFEFVGVELTEDYLPIIEGRLSHAVKMRADALAEAEAQEAETLF
jgi:DNA modification methylase